MNLLERAIDNTALHAYMECPKKFEYSMLRNRRHKGPPSPPLAYGSIWHTILEAHYKTGGNESVVLDNAMEQWEPHSGSPDDHRTLKRALTEYDNYRERWGATPSDEAKRGFGETVGTTEGVPLVELAVNVIWRGARHPYAGKIDRIFQLQNQYYVEDHKTSGQFGSSFFRQFELDGQMIGYTVVAGELIGVPIAGVRINAHICYKKDSKFEREIITFSKERLDDWKENYNYWIDRINLDLAAGIFPRNFKACAGKYGMCPYAGVCSLSPRLREQVLEHDFADNPWNPLELKGESKVGETEL